ncbi:hypothetical protein DYB37_012621 [Aphanomyces astaci]|uniref:HTH CENPB-type domain-containing protein n=1 Tax=Aphanomyces astaci TaxID=112090 RepID=A0A3R6Y2D2_APHAT|nr:hypothetical protein DYB35_008088 [Aphanomyces astaci]RHZ32321.1 hypothetical protein DYB37_012621 [Aphanomyces astaci]
MTSFTKMKKKMSLVDKHALYLEHLNNPTTSYSNLAIWAAHEFNLATTPSKSTIGNTLKHHATQCDRADSKDRTNNRRSSLPDVEEALVAWVLRCEELGVCLTGELIRKQALAFCATMEVPADQRHSFSKGWLYKFQRKHGLTSKLQHGEAGSTPPETVEAGRAEMQTITTGYEPADIYNMDETSFFYCLSPHRSITRNRVPVKQRQLQNALDQIDAVMSGRQDRLYEVPLVEAMGWAQDAWRSIEQSTVRNCWRRTGILTSDSESSSA